MSFSFNIDEKEKLVTVTCDKSVSSEERLKVLNELIEILKERTDLNIFLDVSHADMSMTDEEQIEFGELLAENKRYFDGHKTAVLVNNDRLFDTLFLSSAYLNGFDHFLEFDSKKEAYQWLHGEIR